MNRAQPFAKLSIVALAGMASLVGMTGMAPEPDPIPRRWELKVDVGALRVTTMEVAGQPRAFAYMTYKVTNKSGKDLLFAPSFELSFGGPKAVRAGSDIPAEVTDALLAKIGDPLVQDQIAVIGTLLNGDENARQGLVIWSCENLAPQKLSMYAAGFSGETATVELPSPKDPKVKEKAILRKTLMVQYAQVGEIGGRGDKALDVSEQRWIMR